MFSTMASVKLAHLRGGSLGVLDDLARLDMPDIPTKETPFGLEGADAVPPTPMDPKTQGGVYHFGSHHSV